MSEPLPIGAPTGGASEVRAAIARAAGRTGADFDYLLAQARIESSLNPQARARTSSATGLHQFTRATWLETMERHGAEHGLGWAQAAIAGGRLDPATRAQILALRDDPEVSSLMAGELAGDNAAFLANRLGRAPDSTELYLAHFLGAGGAGQFLAALASDPQASAASVLPAAAAANRGIFYESNGVPRSVAGVMDLLRGKLAQAMEADGGDAMALPAPITAARWAEAPPPAAPNWPAAPLPTRPSMAETLRRTFALGSADGQSAPAQVHAAYGRLRSMGL